MNDIQQYLNITKYKKYKNQRGRFLKVQRYKKCPMRPSCNATINICSGWEITVRGIDICGRWKYLHE